MSPAARKFKQNLILPTITSASAPSHDLEWSFSNLRVAHKKNRDISLLSEWMNFTHILGKGILAEI